MLNVPCHVVQVRTPGVGMEKSAKLGSEEWNARKQELTEKLAQLESRISKAVELEDYDLAGIYNMHM